MQDAGLVVERADDLAAFRVGADDEAERAVAIHMVVTALGIILDDEDDGVAAEAALGDGLDDAGRGRGRCRRPGPGACGGAAGVVVGQIEEDGTWPRLPLAWAALSSLMKP